MTNTTAIAPIQAFYDRNTLERALPMLVHDKFGQKRPIPKGQGLAIKFRRYEKFTVATTALTEGTDPAGQDMTKTDVTLTLAQYGDFTKLTDMVIETNLDPMVTEATDVLGEQMGETLDTIYRNALILGSAVRYSSLDANRAAVIHKLLEGDLKAVERSLRANNAKRFTKLITASTSVGTVGIRPAYWAIVHTDTIQDLEAITGYKSVAEYANQTGVMESEEGSFKGIRFVSTTNAKIWGHGGAAVSTSGLKSDNATNVDVYATLVFGQDAYGICPLSSLTSKSIITNKEDAGSPLHLYGYVGWKATTVCGILNNSFMYRIEHGVTA
jgi:N4-gp56 family major capsid protein